MSKKLRALKPREVIRALERGGFVVVRTNGSHSRLVHPDDHTRKTTIASHASKDLPRGTLRDILEQARLSEDEFLALL